MNEYGGYFGLEKKRTSVAGKIDFTPYFKSARSIINFIIKEMNCSHIYLPAFICDVILESIKANNTTFQFYHIDSNLEIDSEIELKEGEMLLYINYFGLKRNYCVQLSQKHGPSLLIDNVHDYFHDSPYNSFSFNSARKYFGVPDGAKLMIPASLEIAVSELVPNQEYITTHLNVRDEEGASSGYELYKENEKMIDCAIQGISEYSKAVLNTLDYESILAQRTENFIFLHQALQDKNGLSDMIDINEMVSPISYPYLPKVKLLHEDLWHVNIYASVLWPSNSEYALSEFEQNLVKYTLHLPVDHRYNTGDMENIVNEILKLEERVKK